MEIHNISAWATNSLPPSQLRGAQRTLSPTRGEFPTEEATSRTRCKTVNLSVYIIKQRINVPECKESRNAVLVPSLSPTQDLSSCSLWITKKPKRRRLRPAARAPAAAARARVPSQTTARAVNHTSPPRSDAHNLRVKRPLTTGSGSAVINAEEPSQVSSARAPAAMLSRTKPPLLLLTPALLPQSLSRFLPPVRAGARCKKCSSVRLRRSDSETVESPRARFLTWNQLLCKRISDLLNQICFKVFAGCRKHPESGRATQK